MRAGVAMDPEIDGTNDEQSRLVSRSLAVWRRSVDDKSWRTTTAAARTSRSVGQSSDDRRSVLID